MSDACDKCGLEDPECKCYVYELEKRIEAIEECVLQLTIHVKDISEILLIRKQSNER